MLRDDVAFAVFFVGLFVDVIVVLNPEFTTIYSLRCVGFIVVFVAAFVEAPVRLWANQYTVIV